MSSAEQHRYWTRQVEIVIHAGLKRLFINTATDQHRLPNAPGMQQLASGRNRDQDPFSAGMDLFHGGFETGRKVRMARNGDTGRGVGTTLVTAGPGERPRYWAVRNQ